MNPLCHLPVKRWGHRDWCFLNEHFFFLWCEAAMKNAWTSVQSLKTAALWSSFISLEIYSAHIHRDALNEKTQFSQTFSEEERMVPPSGKQIQRVDTWVGEIWTDIVLETKAVYLMCSVSLLHTVEMHAQKSMLLKEKIAWLCCGKWHNGKS